MFNNEFEDNNIGNEFSALIERYEGMQTDDGSLFFEEEEFEWIIEYYETRNELGKALDAVVHAMRQYPFSELFLIKKAELFFEAREPAKALDMLDKAEVLDAGDIEIYLLRSEILSFQGKYRMAISTLKHARSLATDEDLEEVFLAMSEVYESWEKFELVFQCLTKVLKLNPANEEALNRIWFCVDMTEKYGESIELHKDLINKDPYSYLAWYNLGQAYFGLGLYEKASEAFEYVTLINEDYEIAYRDWAETLIRMDRPTEAIEVYDTVLRVAEPSEEVYFGLGWCYEQMDKANKARYHYRKAVHLDPYYDEAFYRIAEIYRKEGKHSDALNNYKKALKLDDENVDYLRGFADVSFALGNYTEAISNYQKITALKPAEQDHWIHLGRYQFEVGHTEDALMTIERAEDECGVQAALSFYKAAFQFSSGRKQAGLESLAAGLSLNAQLYPIVFDLWPSLINDQDVLDLINTYITEEN